MSFKLRIAQLRLENGLSLSQMAATFQKSEGTIRAWESGRTKPDIDTLFEIANHFGITTDYLLGKANAKRAENETLAEDLGINDAAIENLRYCRERGYYINDLIGSPVFSLFMRYFSISRGMEDSAYLKDSKISDIQKMILLKQSMQSQLQVMLDYDFSHPLEIVHEYDDFGEA